MLKTETLTSNTFWKNAKSSSAFPIDNTSAFLTLREGLTIGLYVAYEDSIPVSCSKVVQFVRTPRQHCDGSVFTIFRAFLPKQIDLYGFGIFIMCFLTTCICIIYINTDIEQVFWRFSKVSNFPNLHSKKVSARYYKYHNHTKGACRYWPYWSVTNITGTFDLFKHISL